MDIEKLIQVGTGTGGIGLLAFLIKHFILSGPERLLERRRRDDEANLRTVKWETDWKACEQARLLELRRRERLAWAYDDLRGAARRLCGLNREKDDVPHFVLDEIEAAPDAATILNVVQ